MYGSCGMGLLGFFAPAGDENKFCCETSSMEAPNLQILPPPSLFWLKLYWCCNPPSPAIATQNRGHAHKIQSNSEATSRGILRSVEATEGHSGLARCEGSFQRRTVTQIRFPVALVWLHFGKYGQVAQLRMHLAFGNDQPSELWPTVWEMQGYAIKCLCNRGPYDFLLAGLGAGEGRRNWQKWHTYPLASMCKMTQHCKLVCKFLNRMGWRAFGLW